jgi:hypothetical protein
MRTNDNVTSLGKKNIGAFFERTKGKHEQGIREKAFSEEWRHECKEYNILPKLFTKHSDPHLLTNIIEIDHVHRFIAATLMQWIGTSVGFCFLTKALKKCGYQVTKIEYKNE